MREAFSEAWGSLTGVNDEGKLWRWLFLLIFLGGIAWAVYSYLQLQILREEKYFEASVSPTSVDADKKRLDGMISEVREASGRRSNSFMASQTMRDMGKYVFDDPTLRPMTQDLPSLAGQVPVLVPETEIPVEPPPAITLRAIMNMGKDRVALLDISGVGTGLIVRQGGSFQNGKGRIVRITDDRVTVRWKGKTWNITPGF